MFQALATTLRRDGVRATLRKAVAHLVRSPVAEEFDRRYGTDTGGLEPLWSLNIESRNVEFGTRYEATQEEELVSAINFLKEDVRRFVFVDLGCGKGRTLIIAASQGFKEVIGVEFAAELANIARANLSKVGASNARVLQQDAAEFEFPAADTVLYLYNPFSQQVFQRVIASLRRRIPRGLYVIYKSPQCSELLDSSGFLERFGNPPGAPHIKIWRQREVTALPRL